jgi:hypothetical protein
MSRPQSIGGKRPKYADKHHRNTLGTIKPIIDPVEESIIEKEGIVQIKKIIKTRPLRNPTLSENKSSDLFQTPIMSSARKAGELVTIVAPALSQSEMPDNSSEQISELKKIQQNMVNHYNMQQALAKNRSETSKRIFVPSDKSFTLSIRSDELNIGLTNFHTGLEAAKYIHMKCKGITNGEITIHYYNVDKSDKTPEINKWSILNWKKAILFLKAHCGSGYESTYGIKYTDSINTFIY